jgi:hypothetical protein
MMSRMVCLLLGVEYMLWVVQSVDKIWMGRSWYANRSYIDAKTTQLCFITN